MNISSETAMKMVEEKMAREAKPAQPEQNEQPEVQKPTPEPEQAKEDKPEEKAEPETKPEEVPQETGKEDKPDTEQKEEPKAEDEGKPDENKDKSDKRPPKQKYTHEERTAHKFAQEQRRRREEKQKRQEAEKRVKELEAELEKYKGLTLKDFENNVENWTNWKLKERDMQNEVESTKKDMERQEAEAAARETERRVNLSFESEEERDDYNELIRTNGPKFYEALQEADPNGVVLDYLNSVEKYPIVLKKLMTDMDALRHVFRDKDPYVLRMNLHQFTKELLEGKPEQKKADDQKAEPEQKTKPSQEPKPAIPVTGRQVTASAKPTEPVHDRAYWNEYLRQHPNG
jgi:hypothetical protein